MSERILEICFGDSVAIIDAFCNVLLFINNKLSVSKDTVVPFPLGIFRRQLRQTNFDENEFNPLGIFRHRKSTKGTTKCIF